MNKDKRRIAIRAVARAVALLILLYAGWVGWLFFQDWHSRVQRSLAENAGDGNLTRMRLCLALGASPNGTVGGTGPALTFAAMMNRIDSIRFLLSHGSNINIQDKWGMTPLMVACDHGYTDAVRFLLDAGADPNVISKGFEPGMNAMNVAHDGEIRALLLSHGANLPENNR